MKEMVGGCCVCSDDRGWPENPLVYCDGQSCTVAVHQACYGIVTVPTGPWYCRKCESQERTARVKCELCPSKYGALKKTDNSGWAHVVCALYIPEVRFGNVTTMEPIQLQLIPAERFNKVCYICEEQGKPSNATVGACMQCNKTGCKQQFHVTCAQGLGLLCEEAGNYLDNVKYCGYCQHHYSKLKKGGNVKTIPPYKPVSSENHMSDSNSEKEADSSVNSKLTASSQSSSSSSLNRRSKTSSSGKTSSNNSKSNNSLSKTTSSSSHQKTVHNSSSKSDRDKIKVSNSTIKSAKSTDDSATTQTSTDNNTDIKIEKNDRSTPIVKEVKAETDSDLKVDVKETKSGKKRKANSRTPTPITVPSENISVVISASSLVNSCESSANSSGTTNSTAAFTDKIENIEKPKKVKTDLPISVTISQPTVVLTATTVPTNIKRNSPPTVITEPISPSPSPQNTPTQPIIQSAINQSSLVVSLPLASANLSPTSHILAHQASVVTAPPSFSSLTQEHSNSSSSIPDRSTPSSSVASGSTIMTGGSTNQNNNGVITTEMSGGGLKVTYEKQTSSSSLQMELERVTPTEQEVPAKRARSQSSDKTEKEKMTRAKKRGSNSSSSQYNNAASSSRRSSRSQHPTPPPQVNSTNIRSASQIKESPPSSPSSESQGSTSVNRTKSRGRKSAPASISGSSNSKDTKDNLKIFQNGMTAPHMMGNQLNPNSNMAQKMTDHLNSELEAHSIFNMNESSNLIGPQLHQKVIANARASSSGSSSTASAASGFSMLGGGGGSIPQTLDQLLERQWEQGSQFLMEQAQHFDIASLLSCLHQLRAENLRLEEHVSSLIQRRDHLLAVNARLAIPLTGQPTTAQSSHSHTVNNIHPAVTNHPESSRARHNGVYPSHAQMPTQHQSLPVENGLPNDSNQQYPHQHRSPGSSQTPTGSSVRWS